MKKKNFLRSPHYYGQILLTIAMITGLLAGCQLPQQETFETPKAQPETEIAKQIATATPAPRDDLPPALVEVLPLPKSKIGLQQPISLYFNQPMDKESVEGAIQFEPRTGGRFEWQDDQVLTFVPDQTLAPDSSLKLVVNTTAQAVNHKNLQEPFEIEFQTADMLKVSQFFPADGALDIDPESVVFVNFNQPVIPLGGQTDADPAFSLSPEVSGKGEWLNTSTYIFKPDLSMDSGTRYELHLNQKLTATSGALMDPMQTMTTGFSTTKPYVLSVLPLPGELLNLDGPVTLKFNIRMSQASVEEHFQMVSSEGKVIEGSFEWEDNLKQCAFTPDRLLERNMTYTVQLAAGAESLGGLPINKTTESVLTTFPTLTIDSAVFPHFETYSNQYGSFNLVFTTPVNADEIKNKITIEPDANIDQPYVYNQGKSVSISGFFSPETEYLVKVDGRLQDVWGGKLGETLRYPFSTPPSEPALTVATDGSYNNMIFVPASESEIVMQATNVNTLSLELAPISLDDMLTLVHPDNYNYREQFLPTVLEKSTISLNLTKNKSELLQIPLTYQGNRLSPGFYFLGISSPDIEHTDSNFVQKLFLVVSENNLVMKVSPEQVMVWGTRLTDHSPVRDAPVKLFTTEGELLTSGWTDADGFYTGTFERSEHYYSTCFALVGEPGEDQFGFSISTWGQFLNLYEMGIDVNYYPPDIESYMYADRPLYRPGDTVHFKGAIFSRANGLPIRSGLDAVTVRVISYSSMSGISQELYQKELSLSSFGTIEDSIDLSPETPTGIYHVELSSDERIYGYFYFNVAAYRKPEIDITMDVMADEFLATEDLVVNIQANYYFGMPGADRDFQWVAMSDDYHFFLPGYQVGPVQLDWYLPAISMYHSTFGGVAQSGEGKTDGDGKAIVTVEGDGLALADEVQGTAQKITFEANFIDESGLWVSHRESVLRHPEIFYIGVKPESYLGRAGTPLEFSILTVNWDKDPVEEILIEATFESVELVLEETGDPFKPYRYVTIPSVIDSANPITDAEGRVRLSFTPPSPGNYQLTLRSGNAVSQVLLWVTGEESAVWPRQPQNQINLVMDAEIYQPGQDAHVFIPNPFAKGAKALVTIERGKVMETRVVDINESGYYLTFPITEESVPNVFVSAILLGKDETNRPNYKLGIQEIKVAPLIKTLNVDLALDPTETEPGETVSATLLITDAEGQPVQGEFSIAVVDKALLDMIEPNSRPIEEAFYGIQPLSVQTSLSLKTYASQLYLAALDLGLGGGFDESSGLSLRDDFRDTAFWRSNIITGADGTSKIAFPLPDSLTTWVVTVRGLTEDYLVGQAEAEIITRKELMIQPVTPRFLVDGDLIEIAAVVHNNSGKAVEANVSLQGVGFTLQNPTQQTQSIMIEMAGHARVSWEGRVESVETVSLIFQAVAGDLFDATTPVWGDLTVKRYAMPYTFSTAGSLSDAGERLELVSLPISADPKSGDLTLELTPSLTTALLDGLKAIKNMPFRDTLSILSALLANFNAHDALSKLGVDSPTLEADLEEMIGGGIQELLDAQNYDGGWPWWPDEVFSDAPSNPFITAYVVMGLTQVVQAGLEVPQHSLDQGMAYLYHSLQEPKELDAGWRLDQLAFQVYALRDGEMDLGTYVDGLFTRRSELNPWALALLGLSIDQIQGHNNRVKTILSDLEAQAIRSATAVHWASKGFTCCMPGSPNFNTAVSLFALAQLDPASTSLPPAARYLLVHRSSEGLWSSTFESAWALIAITEALQGTGDYQAEFAYQASLNERLIAEGAAKGTPPLNAVTASTGIINLYPDSPNAVVIERGAGKGTLYYRVDLQTYQQASDAQPINQGIGLERHFYLTGKGCPGGEDCDPIQSIELDPDNPGQMITVGLTVNVPEDIYHFILEDFIPSGTEILDTKLLTSRTVIEEQTSFYDTRSPFKEGWGWWLFKDPQIYDDHILWVADYLPSGTYTLTYQLIPTHRGSFQVLPAHAWQYFYPEVQGTSAGDVFTIK